MNELNIKKKIRKKITVVNDVEGNTIIKPHAFVYLEYSFVYLEYSFVYLEYSFVESDDEDVKKQIKFVLFLIKLWK